MSTLQDEVEMNDIAAFEAASREIIQQMKRCGGCALKLCQIIIREKNDVSIAVRSHFPGALPATDILEQVQRTIEKRGHTPKNTLYAQSVCPDEINNEASDVTNLLAGYLGEVFHLGGLAGIPFTGKTGFGAFSHHVPEDGHCFVLLAPHVGYDHKGGMGKYVRAGQEHEGYSSSCGANVGAWNKIRSSDYGQNEESSDTPEDTQMAYICREVNKRKDIIMVHSEGSDEEQVELVKQMHEIALDLLEKIVHVNFGGEHSTLTILSGIQINMPRPSDHYFEPLTFYTLDKKGNKTDLFLDAFGKPSTYKPSVSAPE